MARDVGQLLVLLARWLTLREDAAGEVRADNGELRAEIRDGFEADVTSHLDAEHRNNLLAMIG